MKKDNVPHKRLKAAVRRNTAEMSWAVYKLAAMNKLSGTPIDVNFFHFAYIALEHDILRHLISVTEENPEVASFWYIRRCVPNEVENAVHEAGLSIDMIQNWRRKLKLIRDKTLFHIDKKAVVEPRDIWKKADVKKKDLHQFVQQLFQVMRNIHTGILKENFEHHEYAGDDVRAILKYKIVRKKLDSEMKRIHKVDFIIGGWEV